MGVLIESAKKTKWYVGWFLVQGRRQGVGRVRPHPLTGRKGLFNQGMQEM